VSGYTVDVPGIGTLRTSLAAAKRVNATCGSYFDQLQRLVAQDFATYVALVAAGLGKKPEDVEAKVFDVGLDDLNEPLTKFVKSLKNGGRDPDLLPPGAEGDDTGES
jgi:hypothetical protein